MAENVQLAHNRKMSLKELNSQKVVTHCKTYFVTVVNLLVIDLKPAVYIPIVLRRYNPTSVTKSKKIEIIFTCEYI